MAQIKLTIPNEFKKNIEKKAKKIGIKPTQYIVSLIVKDINFDINEGKNERNS